MPKGGVWVIVTLKSLQLGKSSRYKHRTQQSNTFLFTQRRWKLVSTQNLYADTHSSLVQKRPNLEATRMSSSGRWINKLSTQTVEYYSVRIGKELSSHEKI